MFRQTSEPAVAVCLAIISMLSLAAASSGRASQNGTSTATLLLSQELPDRSKLLLYEKRITTLFKLYGQSKVATDTVYYLQQERPETGKRTRVWEQGYLCDFQRQPTGKPTSFTLALVDGYTSSIALTYWEATDLRFFQISPTKVLASSAEERIKRLEGKEFADEARKITLRDYGNLDPTIIAFRRLYPAYGWDSVAGNPPSVTKIWRQEDSWNIQIAVGKPDMHLQLRDGTKEWVWINKP